MEDDSDEKKFPKREKEVLPYRWSDDEVLCAESEDAEDAKKAKGKEKKWWDKGIYSDDDKEDKKDGEVHSDDEAIKNYIKKK